MGRIIVLNYQVANNNFSMVTAGIMTIDGGHYKDDDEYFVEELKIVVEWSMISREELKIAANTSMPCLRQKQWSGR